MANSGKSSSNSASEKVAAALRPALAPGAHLLLGLSGGVDSVALLEILAGLAASMRFSLRALHVNHGTRTSCVRKDTKSTRSTRTATER